MGLSGSKSRELEAQLAANPDIPQDARFVGFENPGAICFANSVLQALFHCHEFRERLVAYARDREREVSAAAALSGSPVEEGAQGIVDTMGRLFRTIVDGEKRAVVFEPREFVRVLRRRNPNFGDPEEHQDAHEFLNFVTNEMAEELEKRAGGGGPRAPGGVDGKGAGNSHPSSVGDTFVHKLFQGLMTTQSRCLECGTVTCRDETFFDIALDIGSSSRTLTECLSDAFDRPEILKGGDKFMCDTCHGLQEATKRSKLKQLPQVLIVSLKTFKYVGGHGPRLTKVSRRVVFPLVLRKQDPHEEEYSLFAVVVHAGVGALRGHYVTVVRAYGGWLLFDDESVRHVDETWFRNIYGSEDVPVRPDSVPKSSCVAYLLFYECSALSSTRPCPKPSLPEAQRPPSPDPTATTMLM